MEKLKGRSYNPHGDYILIRFPGHPREDNRGYVPEHVLVVEKALGRHFPNTVVVHHHDEVTTNNSNSNLVVCQDEAYHRVLHQRTRAYRACGHANWRKCVHCGTYEDPAFMRHNAKCRHCVCSTCRGKSFKDLRRKHD